MVVVVNCGGGFRSSGLCDSAIGMPRTCSRRVSEAQRRGERLEIRRVIDFVPVTAFCEHWRERINEEPICAQPMAFKVIINTIYQTGSDADMVTRNTRADG